MCSVYYKARLFSLSMHAITLSHFSLVYTPLAYRVSKFTVKPKHIIDFTTILVFVIANILCKRFLIMFNVTFVSLLICF
jgi:hypothetical protein